MNVERDPPFVPPKGRPFRGEIGEETFSDPSFRKACIQDDTWGGKAYVQDDTWGAKPAFRMTEGNSG